jgi:GAF domain-containing protein
MPDDLAAPEAAEGGGGARALVSQATTLLVEGRDPHAFSEVLSALGSAMDASRAAIVAASPSPTGQGLRMEVRHQWVRAGTPRLSPVASGWLPYFPRWARELAAGRLIKGATADFPADEREILERDGVRALAAVPVITGDRWYGHISVDTTVGARTWTVADIELLLAVAEAVGRGIELRAQAAATARRNSAWRGAERAARILREAPAWRTALPEALEALRAGTGARGAWVYEVREGSDRTAYLLAEARAPGSEPASPLGRQVSVDPAAGARFARGETVVGGSAEPASDARAGSPGDAWIESAFARLGIRSWVIAPALPFPGQVDAPAGGVGLDSERPRDWGDGGREAVEAVAAVIAECLGAQRQDDARRPPAGGS